ncbi:MAG: metallophosphoesterase [Melioribacteraceae bacterium]|nr:metallophosphoesterase [Melioribacteraceae bacterium]
MRLIHLSDLHLNSVHKRSNIKKFKRTLKHAIKTGFDHLVITGDLTDNANEKDFIILRKLLAQYDLLNSKLVSIVIGNHDIFGGVQTALDVIDFPRKCSSIDYDQKIKEFYEYFRELFRDAYMPGADSCFPYAKTIKDKILIGLNSIDRYSRLKNPFASNGKVYKDQMENFNKIMNQESIKIKEKIVLIHHHFYKNKAKSTASANETWNKIESFTMKLRGKKRLVSHFHNAGIKLVLHGHSHEMRDYNRGGVRFLNAGASIENGGDDSSIFLIDYKDESLFIKQDEVPQKTFNPIPVKLPDFFVPKLLTQPSN